MSCIEELEGVVKDIIPQLKDCTMALYDFSHLNGANIQALCSVGDEKCRRVFTVSSATQRIGDNYIKCDN